MLIEIEKPATGETERITVPAGIAAQGDKAAKGYAQAMTRIRFQGAEMKVYRVDEATGAKTEILHGA